MYISSEVAKNQRIGNCIHYLTQNRFPKLTLNPISSKIINWKSIICIAVLNSAFDQFEWIEEMFQDLKCVRALRSNKRSYEISETKVVWRENSEIYISARETDLLGLNSDRNLTVHISAYLCHIKFIAYSDTDTSDFNVGSTHWSTLQKEWSLNWPKYTRLQATLDKLVQYTFSSVARSSQAIVCVRIDCSLFQMNIA